MTITTSYLKKDTENTLDGAPLSKYRLVHWLVDILKNFMADPINLRDERLSWILARQDGTDPNDCKSLFIVDVPFNTDTRKACTTPAIMVSVGETTYPITPLNTGFGAEAGAIHARLMYERTFIRSITANIAVVTESCDGTILLADIIEDFLMRSDIMLMNDGMLQHFSVNGSSAPKKINTGEGLNAKDIYQIVITVTAIGGITWTSDTQGPVFRGITGGTTQK